MISKYNIFYFIVICFHLYMCLGVKVTKDDPIVSTENGYIKGKYGYTSTENKTYSAFLGIPYADIPVGNLRFEPPQPAKNWTDIRNATEKPNNCVQRNPITSIIEGSEDCLYLNIYTPITSFANISQLLPVMVWIHGGAFQTGSGGDYNPELFLNKDVIIITVNYRLGVFGFITTEDLISPGNNGLRDQIAALKWIQSNVANFGGDRHLVTIFGESAGGAAVSFLVLSPLAQGLFSGAISQSGTALSHWGFSRNVSEKTKELAKRFNVNTEDSLSIINGLREINSYTLSTVSEEVGYTNFSLIPLLEGFTWTPVIEPLHPEAVIYKKMHEEFRTGSFNRVPQIIGFNSQEFAYFAPFVNLSQSYLSIYDSNPGHLVGFSMNLPPGSDIELSVGNQIKQHYFASTPVVETYLEFIQFRTDFSYVRPICETIKQMSQYTPVFTYEFTHEGDVLFPNRLIPGVAHVEDVFYMFPFTPEINAEDNIVRERFIRMWTNFAKFRNPTPTSDEVLQNINWPVSTAAMNASITYLDIGTDLSVKSGLRTDTTEFWDNLFDTYGVPPYDAY